MQLIGYLDSPFVRRVAISMRFLGIEYQHRELSIFRDFEEFRTINPTVKVPTLVLDDGRVLIDSTLIINYLESQLAEHSLMPEDPDDFVAATQHTAIALVAMEKVAQLIYETSHRPGDRQHRPWIERLQQQLEGAVDLMESAVATSVSAGHTWLFGEMLTQADISIAVAWRFILHIDSVRLDPGNYPSLSAFSRQAEALPEFQACPLSG
jgi:glutathione S-transferase